MTFAKSRTGKLKLIITLVLLAFIISSSCVITFGSSISDSIPTWTEIGKAVGVYDGTSVIQRDRLSVHVMDIEKSDSIFINFNDYNILIDAGDTSSENHTTTYLKRCGIEKLNLLVATHPDADHVHEIPSILENFEVERYWTCPLEDYNKPKSALHDNIDELLDKKNIPITYVESGYEFSLGEIKLHVIAPVGKYSGTNNNSVVIKLEFRDTSWLFCGDIEEAAENDILANDIDIDADVIKIAHHGSNSSSSEEFLKAVSPAIAVISTSKTSNLPNNTVLKRLEDLDTRTFITEYDGQIVLYTSGDKISVEAFDYGK